MTEDKSAIPEQGATGSPSADMRDTAPGVSATRSDRSPAEEDESEMGGTIRFSDYSRQVAWDRFWDQMYALMLPIVVKRSRQRSSDSAAATSDVSKQKEL